MTSKITKALCLLMMGLTACQTIPTATEAPKDIQLSEVLINSTEVFAVVNTQVNAVDLEQQAAEWGYSLKTKEKLEGLDMYVMTFDCPPGIDPHDAVVELERLQPNSTVGVNHKYDLQLAPSALSITNTGYADELINWPSNGCEANIPIGIIDGGLSIDFLTRYRDRISYKSFVKGTPSDAAMKHGDAVASILVEPRRLNSGQFHFAAVVSEGEKGEDFSGILPMLKALDWMVKSDVKVANVSLAGPRNPTLEKAINRAAEKGLIIVAAVGNDGENASPRYPAAYDNVIATTAVNKDKNIYHDAVRGEHVDFAAPGVGIYVPNGEAGQFFSGTSIAAPFVTAVIASHFRNTDRKSTRDTVNLLSESTIDLGEIGKDPIFGSGLIKAKNNCLF